MIYEQHERGKNNACTRPIASHLDFIVGVIRQARKADARVLITCVTTPYEEAVESNAIYYSLHLSTNSPTMTAL